MDVTFTEVLVELAEKMGLLAAAALFAVLLPPLRNRLLGVGQRADKLVAVILGVVLSMWGAQLGLFVRGEHVNLRAAGILIAAILGGWKAGGLTGFAGGVFYALQRDAQTAPWVAAASVIDGLLAGLIAERWPRWVQGPRLFLSAIAAQTTHLLIVGTGLLAVGHAARYAPALPATVVQLVVNAAGATLFMLVAHLVIAREEGAVALMQARVAAEQASLEALRRRLEPHFLFNALTAIRATIRRDPAAARELVSDLADLYRYLLSHPEDAPVRAEIEHACAYLAIERARLGEGRLRIELDAPEELTGYRVPALLLQPLVENAVRHGIARRRGEGVIRIRIHRDHRDLVVEVEDEVPGSLDAELLPATEVGSGIALATLRARLKGRFKDKASLELEANTEGATARVRLPLASVIGTAQREVAA